MEYPINQKHINYVAEKTGIDKAIVEKVLIADCEYMDLVIENFNKEEAYA